MGTYVIGDVQGCFDSLQALLDQISFNDQKDQLWFAGDLVNRGPKSLETLRFISTLKQVQVVLGNHDLHLLAVAEGVRKPGRSDTISEILAAPDCHKLLSWLKKQPLVHYDEARTSLMVHAGFPPFWSLEELLFYSHQFSSWLQTSASMMRLFGNQPDLWNDALSETQRYRYLINATTRMRLLDQAGRLDFTCKDRKDNFPPGLMPWYASPHCKLPKDTQILFGHWASLEGNIAPKYAEQVLPLDTGCVWGGRLTAYHIEQRQLVSIQAVEVHH